MNAMIPDHCRVGSSEIKQRSQATRLLDHCRVGSSEIPLLAESYVIEDHCRVAAQKRKKSDYTAMAVITAA